MARPLFLADQHHLPSLTFTLSSLPPAIASTLLLLLIAVVVIISLCTTHGHRKMAKVDDSGDHHRSPFAPSPQKKLFSGTLSGVRGKGKALLINKLVSWKMLPGDGDREVEKEGEKEIWRKTILMGDKCRPLDFSGLILYDENGNQLRPPVLKEVKV